MKVESTSENRQELYGTNSFVFLKILLSLETSVSFRKHKNPFRIVPSCHLKDFPELFSTLQAMGQSVVEEVFCTTELLCESLFLLHNLNTFNRILSCICPADT